MNIQQALDDLQGRITSVAPDAVFRTSRRSEEEAVIRTYVAEAQVEPVQEAVRDRTIELLTEHGLDVQVIVYDIATSLPTGEATE